MAALPPPAIVDAARPATPLGSPAESRVLGSDVVIAGVVLAFVVTGLWARQGGVADLTTGWAEAMGSLTRLTALWASACGLAGLLLVARPRSLERRFGLDRLFVWHRILGEAMAILVGLHVATAIAAAAPESGWAGAITDLTGREPYLAAATVGALLVGIVTVSSLRSMRRQLSYETWWFVHLTAYLGLFLAFAHQLTLGTDLAAGVAWWAWVLAHVAVLVTLLWCRWGRLAVAATRPLVLTSMVRESADVATLTLGGRNLRHLRAESGQFFMLRPLRPRLWWQAHPISLSAAPTRNGLSFTVKDRGDFTSSLLTSPVGTKFVVEGPYGVVTPDVAEGRPLLFIVGGVGVAPARSFLQSLGPRTQPVVLYRARLHEDLVHLDELRTLAAERGGKVLTLVGRTAALATRDPFGPAALRVAVPDLRHRTAIVCGPESLCHAARSGLKAAGMPDEQIHAEISWW